MYNSKEYQKNKLNDAEMSLSSRKIERQNSIFNLIVKEPQVLMAVKQAAVADVIK
jgi:hypothetical protein